jgi:UDP-3-O-[3-hydroxymyristoyl] N-acetylglucosamine deacetylase
VRHKILDLVGDLSLVGMPIIGHIVAHKSGHGLNAQMVGKLLSSTLDWITIGAVEHAEAKSKQLQFQHAAL